MDEKDIWEKPPVSEITEQLSKAMENCPKEVAVNVILTGKGAKRFYFAKSLLVKPFKFNRQTAKASPITS